MDIDVSMGVKRLRHTSRSQVTVSRSIKDVQLIQSLFLGFQEYKGQ